jgi:hypothetical protein
MKFLELELNFFKNIRKLINYASIKIHPSAMTKIMVEVIYKIRNTQWWNIQNM